MDKIDVEIVARAICEADKYAPDPDAPIYVGLKKCAAWEGRIEMAEAAIKAWQKISAMEEERLEI